ncbi:MAG: transporter substrate-binding domain-containing protein [Vicinamibacteria bacterium]|nr:transporter substrate-binding domain-containing protein [Vicinamibacteria bacterium]
MRKPRVESCAPAPRARRLHLLGLAVAAASAFMTGGVVQAGDLADVKAKGKLVVATYPLIEDSFMAVDVEAMRHSGLALKDMRDPAHFKGIDLDLMKGFAESLGVALEIRPELAGYGDLIPALDRREGDVAASSFAITPQRLATADFSTPYILQWDVAAVRPDSKIKSIADLKGKLVAVIEGSSHFERLKALNLDPMIRLTKYVLEGYDAVLEGQADYTLLESRAEVGQPVSAQYSGLKVAVRINETSYGIAMRKGSDLKAPLDAYLEGLRKSGELDKILARHGQGNVTKTP